MPGSSMMAYPLTVAAILRRARDWFGGTEIVWCDGRSTYAELDRRARALAGKLLALGLQPGERVATLLWNDATHLEAYFGVPLAGGIVHALNLRQHPSQWERILRQAGDRFAIVSDDLLDRWNEVTPEARPQRILAWPDAYDGPLPDLAETDGAAMGYTSGTTGEPKGVIYSHRALALHALATALPDALDLHATDCVLPLVPMFHANAWGLPYTAALIGCKQVLAGSHFDAASVLDLLAREQVTRSAGVATIWQSVLDALEREPGRWKLHPRLRVNLGGAPAPTALFERFDRAGIAVNMGWGMTEMTPVGTMNPLLSGPDRTRQGRPLPFVEARTAVDGELEVRGPWVASSYHAGIAPESWTADGWFCTGDIVRFDADGLMEIIDRTKDLIRSGGEWISSVALENALACHPDIREAAVIAVPHPKWQERPLALVVLRAGAAADPAAWRQHLEASFPAWQCPDEFRVVGALPRTATGKIDKRALRAAQRQ
ncbi:MAG: fatty acid--CoA ligase [Acidobacteria bacterium]|nr:MAG: fatty acid--CoA ligase [Acidobacteriota bacterium]